MKKTIYLLLVLSLLFACGKKEVKQVSQESKTTEEVFALIETVRKAFAANDKSELQKNTTEEGFRDMTAGSRSFESVEMFFTPKWVEIESSRIQAHISWKSVWTVSGKKTEDSGIAIFTLEGRPLKVSRISRMNPFVSPQP